MTSATAESALRAVTDAIMWTSGREASGLRAATAGIMWTLATAAPALRAATKTIMRNPAKPGSALRVAADKQNMEGSKTKVCFVGGCRRNNINPCIDRVCFDVCKASVYADDGHQRNNVDSSMIRVCRGGRHKGTKVKPEDKRLDRGWPQAAYEIRKFVFIPSTATESLLRSRTGWKCGGGIKQRIWFGTSQRMSRVRLWKQEPRRKILTVREKKKICLLITINLTFNINNAALIIEVVNAPASN